jgi:hypothetical protein
LNNLGWKLFNAFFPRILESFARCLAGDDLHLVDRWCYLGTAKSEQDITALLARGRPVFDRDSYLVLSKALKTNKVVELTL